MRVKREGGRGGDRMGDGGGGKGEGGRNRKGFLQ